MNITPHALVAYDAGLCTIRARADGSKAPLGDETRRGEWKHWQTERPERVTVAKWFASDHPGIGYVCGAISGGLTMLELEGRAVEAGLAKRLGAQCRAMGCGDVWQRIVNGFVDVTPSGGLHYYIRRDDGYADGNVRLASNASGEPLIETRGEGGFTVAAPSHGPVHDTGQPWATVVGGPLSIPVVSAAELEAVFAVCRTFDTAPLYVPLPITPRAQRIAVAAFNGATLLDSWMDDTEAHLARTTDVATVLGEYGWQEDHRAGARTYVTRPGKDNGVSGVINESGRLVVFSTSTPFAPYDGSRRPTSYGVLDIIATYEHGGDRQAAAQAVAERAGVFDARDHWAERLLWPHAVRQIRHERPEFRPESDGGVEVGVLPAEFYDGRPRLEAVRAAALARMVAPTALVHAVLARVAALAPFHIVIPPMIGSVINLSYFTMIVGGPETGKSAVVGVARELLPAPTHVLDGLPLGSGQGLADVLFEYVTEDEPTTGKRIKVRRQTKYNAFVYVDEGEVLGALSGQGSTLLPTLRQIYSSAPIGNTNAREETRRIVPAGRSVFGLVAAIQPTALGPLFAGVALGTPQRFTYAPATDRVLEDARGHVTAIAWDPPRDGRREMFGEFSRLMLSYPAEVVASTRAEHGARARGEVAVNEWAAHANLTRLKIAGILAVFDGRTDVSDDDWWRAGLAMAASMACRDRCRLLVAGEAERAEEAHANKLGRRAATADSVVAEHKVERAALLIARKIRNKGESGAADLRRSFDSASPGRTHFHEGLVRAMERGWVVEYTEPSHTGDDKRTLRPGPVVA